MKWYNISLHFFKTPGHSSGSICIHFRNNLFSGDTILQNSKTVVKLPGGDKEALRKSLLLIFRTFDPSTIIFPGHGDSFKLSEIKINELL